MSDIDDSRGLDPLRQRIVMFEIENGKIKAENLELKAENYNLKARIAKLEDKRFFLSRFEKIYVLSRDTVPSRGMFRSPWTRGEE